MRVDWHADDLGASSLVNSNILTVWESGNLSGASIIANGDALNSAAERINADRDRPIRLMVHLNLSEGEPIAPQDKLPLLINEHGKFFLGFTGIWQLWWQSGERSRRELLKQIKIEWSRQIEHVIEVFAPRQVSGLDGHIHIQMLPFLFPIAADLATKYGLAEIRISEELFHFDLPSSLRPNYLANIAKHLLLNSLAKRARLIIEQTDLRAPDAVAGVLYSGHMTRSVAAAAIMKGESKRLQWLELIFHPGRAATSEHSRWINQPDIWKFYSAPERDMERDELLGRIN